MINNKKKNNKKIVLGLFILFLVLLGTTLFVSFSTLLQEDEIVIKSMTPVYDETSGVVVDDNGIIFNDKNQVVDYKIVLENTQDYDVKISDIKLSTPAEEFLQYEVEEMDIDVISANSTKEITVSFETMGIKGWGRNFADELTANISFEKYVKQEEVTPPAEEDDKEEEKQPEAPATDNEELITNAKELEITSITGNDIEFKTDIKVEDGDEVSTWIYPETEFFGYHEIEVSKDTTKVLGIVETIKKSEVVPGEHNIAIVTDEEETIGYINIYVDEDKEVLQETPQDSTDKEDAEIEPPNTSDKGLLVVLVIATGITGLMIIVVSKSKFVKYSVLVVLLSTTLSTTRAEKVMDLSLNFDIGFESQNVMSQSYKVEEVCYDYNNDGIIEHCSDTRVGSYYWKYSTFISNIYIQNEILEINNYTYAFDVTEDQNGRVMAYLVERNDGSVCSFRGESDVCYDLYLQADGVIYANKDASYYFAEMYNLNIIDNMVGIDTSNVTNMSNMFYYTGYNSTEFTLDVSNFDTSNVTDMSYMFSNTDSNSPTFTLDVSNFDTSNVTDMSYMFSGTGSDSTNLTLDLSGWDTSNVTDMSYMFSGTGYSSETFTLDVSNFDTSNVTDMSYMFSGTGYSSETFTLDVSNFDTSNVTDMSYMFSGTGYSSETFTLDVSNFDTSNVTDMSYMFSGTGSDSTNLTLDLSGWDTSNVTDMGGMFSGTGYDSTTLTLDLSGWDISNVTNMTSMFDDTGYNSENFTLDLSGWNTSNITDMRWMFYQTGYNSENFILDFSGWDTSNVTDMGGMFYQTGYNSETFTLDVSHFDTSNVTNMGSMFSGTGYNSAEFTLDVSNFDTSNVTNIRYMFHNAGYNSTKLNISITIKNPNVTDYSSMFEGAATKEGSQIKVNYTEETEELVDKMIATKTYGANVIRGDCIDCRVVHLPTEDVDNLSIGDEIMIVKEKFNVINQTEDTVTMLAQYNIGLDYKQSRSNNYVKFSDADGWEYRPGPKEIDIQKWSTNTNTYVNNYVEYLKEELGDGSVTGDLITLTELKGLGCTINDDYSVGSEVTCTNSLYNSWLLNGKTWWTRSASSGSKYVWCVNDDGSMRAYTYNSSYIGVRPVITISKETLKNLGQL